LAAIILLCFAAAGISMLITQATLREGKESEASMLIERLITAVRGDYGR
jgi:hypothetical protein